MRILLDECVNLRVRQAFPDHEVLTVAEADWRTLPDAQLTAQAQGQFDVFVTIDRGFEFEINLKKLTFGIVIVHVNGTGSNITVRSLPRSWTRLSMFEPAKWCT